MCRDTVLDWMRRDHRRTVLMFAEEHNMSVTDVWNIINQERTDV